MNQLDFEQTLKEQGMKSAAIRHREALQIARNIAWELATHYGHEISIEDVREAISMRGIGILNGSYKNWMGSVFKGKEWESVGFEIARHPGSHGRMVRKWKLREA